MPHDSAITAVPTPPVTSGKRIAFALILASLCSSLMFALHPRLGVRDVDGYAYIMGANSLHRGTGYRGLTGELFNDWPPGHSLLLSTFGDTLSAAMIVNYVSLGLAVALIYLILRRSGWSWQAGAGFSKVLAFGFFRSLANSPCRYPDLCFVPGRDIFLRATGVTFTARYHFRRFDTA